MRRAWPVAALLFGISCFGCNPSDTKENQTGVPARNVGVTGAASTKDGSSIKEAAPAPLTNTEVWQTWFPVPDLEDGLGAGSRPEIIKVSELIKQGQYEQADQVLAKIVADFNGRMSEADAVYVSLANTSELATYRSEQPGKRVVWLDFAFGQALHFQTFIAVVRRDMAAALQASDREVKFRPFTANTYTERGFILNQLKRHDNALVAYRHAKSLAERFSSSRSDLGATWRGIGVTMVDLKDLKGAKAALQESLKHDPNSKVALGELEYIAKLEKQP